MVFFTISLNLFVSSTCFILSFPANLENSAVATGLKKVSFHSDPMAITWAPWGNHVGTQGKSRGPPGEITWATWGNHVGPLGK